MSMPIPSTAGELSSDTPVTVIPTPEGVKDWTDRELAERTYALVVQIAGWQQGANTIISSMQEKMNELMENPVLQNFMSMMG